MYVSRKTIPTLLSVVLAGFAMNSALAGDGEEQKGCDQGHCAQKGGLCHDCGCFNACCDKVCRLTCKPKKVKVTCWKSECDCKPIPGPSCRGCRHVDYVNCDGDKGGDCKGCDSKGGGCDNQKKVVWYDWDVGGGKGDECGGDNCHTRPAKKLMKKEIEVELKGAFEYKWEVVDLCKGCEEKSKDEAPEVKPDADVPPPPPVAIRIISPKLMAE